MQQVKTLSISLFFKIWFHVSVCIILTSIGARKQLSGKVFQNCYQTDCVCLDEQNARLHVRHLHIVPQLKVLYIKWVLKGLGLLMQLRCFLKFIVTFSKLLERDNITWIASGSNLYLPIQIYIPLSFICTKFCAMPIFTAGSVWVDCIILWLNKNMNIGS